MPGRAGDEEGQPTAGEEANRGSEWGGLRAPLCRQLRKGFRSARAAGGMRRLPAAGLAQFAWVAASRLGSPAAQAIEPCAMCLVALAPQRAQQPEGENGKHHDRRGAGHDHRMVWQDGRHVPFFGRALAARNLKEQSSYSRARLAISQTRRQQLKRISLQF